ncbi:MAG: hypothetical protein IKF17_06155 [Clostridia bacterium]|nr:hypothetical protein [Clostridia bacterium]
MRFIGMVEGKGLYAEWNNSHNQIRFFLNGKSIAVYDTDIMNIIEDPIVFRNNTIANELSAEAKDQIQQLARKVDIEELKSDEEKYGNNSRDYIGEALHIDGKRIISLTEISLDEEVEENDKNENSLNKNNFEEKKKEATTKDIKIKQELKMSSMATSTKTIGSVLQRAGKMPKVEGKTFTKLGIVESDRVKDIDKNAKTNTTRFSLVAIASDGTVVPLNLEQDSAEGSNPREISHKVNADGRVEQDDVNSRFRIGNKEETISIKFSNGPGNIEVGYSERKTLGGDGIEGNISYDHQLETSTVYWRPRKDSRDKEYADGIYGTEERAREAKLESAHNSNLKRGKKGVVDSKDNHEYKNSDGDMQTKDEEHQNDLIERARKLINENDEVSSAFTEEEVIKMLEHAHDKGKDLEEAEEDIKEDASRMPTNNR